MKTTGIHLVQALAAALTLTSICLAQQVEQPTAIREDNSWRLVNQDGTWWYYHPNGTWSNWDGTRWNPFQPATQKTGSMGVSGASDSMGLRAMDRHSGDVEVSGAELGMGMGASRNSGLTNNPGATINGKGGIGGTKFGAGLPGIGTGVRLPPSGNLSAPKQKTDGSIRSGGTSNPGQRGAGQAPSGASN